MKEYAKKKRILLRVAYDGTEYAGWQIQPNAPTIEMVLDEAIEKLTGEKVHVIGASRTDAGVSALGNVAVFDTCSSIPADRFAHALNRYMPEDVSIVDSHEVAQDFHPRHCDTRKTYEYRILSSEYPIPQLRHHVWHVPYRLDADKMRQAANILVGEHDFKSFACVKTTAETTVRTVYSLVIVEEPLVSSGKASHDSDTEDSSDIDGEKEEKKSVFCRENIMQGGSGSAGLKDACIYTVRITGNGFLYNMVRIITGTLMQAGRGQITPEQVKNMLESRDRTVAGQTAPPQGLTLVRIDFD